jgi:hypothetical protein
MSTSQGTGISAQRPAAETKTAAGSELSQATTAADARETAPLTGSIAASPDDPRQLEAEIERTRERLGETVQELVARVDVKSRARAKAAEMTGRVKTTTTQARKNAAARAGSVRGQVAGTAATVRQKAISAGGAGTREPWRPLAIASGVLFAGYLILRQYERR